MPPLVNGDRAVANERKFVKYALDPDNPDGKNKAHVFAEVLGYTQDNWQELRSAILEGLSDAEASITFSDQFGDRYAVDIEVTGPTGRSAVVRTAWIYDRKPGGNLSEVPRLVTLYVL